MSWTNLMAPFLGMMLKLYSYLHNKVLQALEHVLNEACADAFVSKLRVSDQGVTVVYDYLSGYRVLYLLLMYAVGMHTPVIDTDNSGHIVILQVYSKQSSMMFWVVTCGGHALGASACCDKFHKRPCDPRVVTMNHFNVTDTYDRLLLLDVFDANQVLLIFRSLGISVFDCSPDNRLWIYYPLTSRETIFRGQEFVT